MLGLLLILTSIGDLWPLGTHVVPEHRGGFWAGFAVTAAGLVLAAPDSGLGDGDVGSAVGFAIIAIGFVTKLRREERFVGAHCGEEWWLWHKRNWALLPFVH